VAPSSSTVLRPYVSGLALRWGAEGETADIHDLYGSLAFVDISGFTRLTELLSTQGKSGAEELTDLLNSTFVELLAIADEHGGELVKWGGDAVLLWYAGEGHAARAVRSCWQMQKAMIRLGRLRTSVGRCRLRMSVGIHTGRFHFFMVGARHRELIVTGPAATVTARMEGIAEAGEILVSRQTARLLEPAVLGAVKGGGLLIVGPPPRVPDAPAAEPYLGQPGRCLAAPVRDHLLAGPVDSEHRQVAVAFVEFSGVDNRLAEAGAEAVAADLHGLIRRIQESCAHHRVTFWESDIGRDGGKVMLVAGAPVGTDDDAGHLLAVTRELVDGGGALSLRAGVNFGRVFAGDFGPSNRRTYSIKGDAVNLAARLMAGAQPGQIYVSDGALGRSRISFSAESLPPLHVKGKTGPVAAHRLGSPSTTSPMQLADTPLTGRDAELEQLAALLRSAQAGQGGCVELLGPPGIGKSRLLTELAARASGVRVLQTRCDAYRSRTPYAPIRDLARATLGIDADAPPADAGTALVDRVKADAPGTLPWLPLLATVVDADVDPTPETDALEERFRRARLESAFADLLDALLADPTLLVIDDAHDMDDASAALTRRLSGRIGTRPWLLVTSRRSEAAAMFGDESPVTRLELQPLSAASATQLIRAMTEARPLSPHREALISNRSAGNPLFLLELLSNGQPGDVGALPDSVEGLLAAQIDRLAPPQRRLLRAASVLGSEVQVPVLSAMLEEDLTPAALAPLSEFLLADVGGRLRFRHGLLRDAAYEGLPYARRRELHAAAGAALAARAGGDAADLAPLLAVHYQHAGDNHAAWRYARLAAERAAGIYANVEAATYFAQALLAGRRVTGTPKAELSAVAESLGDARTHLGEFDPAEQAYRLARRWAATRLDRGRLWLKMAQIADREGRYRTALQRLGRAEGEVGGEQGNGALRLLAEVRTQYGLIRHRQGRNDEALRLLEEGVRLAERAESAEVLATALEHLDMAEIQLGSGDGQHARRALEILRSEGGHPWLEARALGLLGMRAETAGRWSEAAALYAASKALCDQAGDQWTAAIESGNIATILADQGYLEEADLALREASRTFRAAGTLSWVADIDLVLGRVAARRGDFAAAREYLATARDIYVAEGNPVNLAHADALFADCELRAGDCTAARERAERSLSELAGFPDGGQVTPLANRIAGLARAMGGEPAAARDYLSASVEAAREWGVGYQLAVSLRALHELWPEDFPGTLSESEELFDRLGVRPDARGWPVPSAAAGLPAT
jgi:class 3 adenylate cyclase/predicted ATPase